MSSGNGNDENRRAVSITSKSNRVKSSKPSKRIGRPPKSGRDPQELIDIRSKSSPSPSSSPPEGIWSYLSSSERDAHRNRNFHPEDFHVAISDDHGHDVKKQTRWHPMMMNELAMIVARGNFPVDNVDDLIRSAVFWFMGVLYTLEKRSTPGVPNSIPMLAAINRLSMSVYYLNLFDETYDRVKENAKKLIQKGRERQAAVFIFDVMEQLKLIPQKVYRQPALEEIHRDFGELVRKNARVVKVLKGKRRGDQKRNYVGGGEEE